MSQDRDDEMLLHEPKNRKRGGDEICDDENDSTLSLHITATKKPKLTTKQRMKQLRDKNSDLNDFTNLPQKEKTTVYKALLKENEQLQKEKNDEKLKMENQSKLEKEKFKAELEDKQNKIAELNNFITELEKQLNNEKSKNEELQSQLNKIAEEKVARKEKLGLSNVVQVNIGETIRKNYLDLKSEKSIRERLKKADNALARFATPETLEDENANKLQTRKNKVELLQNLVKKYGMTTRKLTRFSACTTAFIFKRCSINVRKARLLRKLLNDQDQNAFASEREVTKMYEEFDEEIKIVEREVTVDGERVTFSEVINLPEVLTSRIQRKIDNGTFEEDPYDKNKLKFAFFGDDGGGYFKAGVSSGNCQNQNSPDNFTVTVVVNGKLTKKIQEAVLEHMATQIENIEVIKVKDKGEDREFQVEWSLGGDYQFDLQACGRKSASSNCCCIYCLFKRKNNAKCFKDAEALQKGQKRETFEKYPDDDGYDGPPIFKKIMPFFILLSLLHIFLGIGLAFINSLEEILKQHDYAALSEEDKKKYADKMVERDELIKEAKKKVDELEASIEAKRMLIDNLKDIIGLQLTEEEMNNSITGCCMNFCCEKIGYESGPMRYCTCCKKTPKGYHELCLGTLNCNKDLKCKDVQKYEKAGGLLSNIPKTIKQLENAIDGLLVKKQKADMKLDGLLMNRFDEMGPNMKEYNDILMELNVSKQAWYQTFTGNHMRMLLKKANIFERLTVITTSERAKYLVQAICFLKKIQDYSEARYLSDDEILKLQTDVNNLKNHMVQYLGDFTVTPKFHILIHHVVEFAQIHKNIGFFTEQQIEHIHARFNTELRRTKFLRKEKRVSWLMKEIYRRNAMYDAHGDVLNEED